MGDMLPDRIGGTEPVRAHRLNSPAVRNRLVEVVRVLPDLLKLAYRLLRDPRVSTRRRIVAGAALAYVVAPIDLIPDFIPGLGQADDALVVALALRLLLDGAGPSVVAEHWDGSTDALEAVDAVAGFGAALVPRRLRRSIVRLVD